MSTLPLALQCLTEIGQQRTVFPGAHRVLFMSSEFYSALLMHCCLEEPCSLEVNTVTKSFITEHIPASLLSR